MNVRAIQSILNHWALFQAICPGCLWARDKRWLLSRVQRLAGPAGGYGPFVPVGGTNRDKNGFFCPGWCLQPEQKAARTFCPGWWLQPGLKGTFNPGWSLQPGQKAFHALFIFTAPLLSVSSISFFSPSTSPPSEVFSPPTLSSLRSVPPRRGRGPASRRAGAGRGRPAAARPRAAARGQARATARAGRRAAARRQARAGSRRCRPDRHGQGLDRRGQGLDRHGQGPDQRAAAAAKCRWAGTSARTATNACFVVDFVRLICGSL